MDHSTDKEWKNNQSKDDLERLKKEDEFIKSVPPRQLVNEFPLYIDRQNLVRYITLIKIFERIRNVKGNIVECGVFRGASLLLWAKLCAIYEPGNVYRQIIGFDTFEGFPSIHEKDQEYQGVGYFDNTNIETIQKSIDLYDENRLAGHLQKIFLTKGDVVETIPAYLDENPHTLISLLYLDFDIYEGTKVALENFLPRMPKGAVIVFDELNEKRWAGETIALLESLNLNNYRLEQFPEEAHISFIQLD